MEKYPRPPDKRRSAGDLFFNSYHSVSARAEFLGIIYDPFFENLGSLANLEGQNFFYA